LIPSIATPAAPLAPPLEGAPPAAPPMDASVCDLSCLSSLTPRLVLQAQTMASAEAAHRALARDRCKGPTAVTAFPARTDSAWSESVSFDALERGFLSLPHLPRFERLARGPDQWAGSLHTFRTACT
jgi:hypothetical protein